MKVHPMRNDLDCCGRPRKGSAALMLVLILSLLVGTFAATVVRRAAAERSRDRERRSIALLESGIDAVQGFDLGESDSVELPVDEATGRMIKIQIVNRQDNDVFLRATLIQKGQPGIFIERKATSQRETSNPLE